MFDEWKRERRLRRELKEIDREYSPRWKAVKDQMDYIPLRAEYDAVTGDTALELNRYELRRLRKKADKFGVEFPPFDSPVDWDKHSWTGHMFLTQIGEAKVIRQIKRARFTYWKE